MLQVFINMLKTVQVAFVIVPSGTGLGQTGGGTKMRQGGHLGGHYIDLSKVEVVGWN